MRLLKDWERARKMFVKVMPLDYRRILLQQNSPTAAPPDPGVLDQWWHERYPGHLRSVHAPAHPGADRPMSLEVARG
jgi:hypothetical protein